MVAQGSYQVADVERSAEQQIDRFRRRFGGFGESFHIAHRRDDMPGLQYAMPLRVQLLNIDRMGGRPKAIGFDYSEDSVTLHIGI